MNDHAKFAPSGSHTWIPCPASIRLSEGIEGTTSEYAMEGTALHEITEKCLRSKLPAKHFLGTTMTSPKDDTDWSMEMDEGHVQAVQYCLDQVKDLADEHQVKGGHLEVTVDLNEHCWGKVDVLMYNDEWLIVTDFKFGRGVSVKAEGNPQQMLYALGAAKFLADKGLPVPPKVLIVILMPRLPPPFRSWDTTVSELKEWYVKSVKPAFAAADDPNTVCNPGEAQCRWCSANGVCTARANFLLGVAEEEFKEYAVGDDGLPVVTAISTPKIPEVKEALTAGVEMLTPDIAARILNYQSDFDNFFKEVGKFALQTALDGGEVPGYKLVHGKSNRKWNAKDDVIAAMLKSDFDVDGYNKKLKSPAQAEKAVGKDNKEALAEYIIKPEGKIILVDESDTRPEVDLTGESEMEEFATETATGGTLLTGSDVFKEDVSIDDIMADFEDEPTSLSEPPPDESVEIDSTEVKELMKGKNPAPPDKRTKKYQLLLEGLKGRTSISAVSELLFKGIEGNLIKGLRNLNERDGYTVTLYKDDTFLIEE